MTHGATAGSREGWGGEERRGEGGERGGEGGREGGEGRRGVGRVGERRGVEWRGGEGSRGEAGEERRGEGGEREGEGRGGKIPLLSITIHAPCTFMNIQHDDANHGITQ